MTIEAYKLLWSPIVIALIKQQMDDAYIGWFNSIPN